MRDHENPEDGTCDLCEARVGNAHLNHPDVCDACVGRPEIPRLRAEVERLDELLAGRKRLMQAVDAAALRPEGVAR